MDTHHPDPPGKHDPRRLLGLAPNATIEQINTAYRRALRRRHPDTRASEQLESDRDDPQPSLAELQAARAQLLTETQHHQNEPAATQTPITPARIGKPPDLLVGPVRYHGPPHTPPRGRGGRH